MSNEIILKNNVSEHFTLICYPDGQHSIKINLDKLNIKEPVKIKCRIRNFGELEVLFCLVKALNKNDFHISSIKFVYLFGMRSDRAFEIGEPNYFRDVLSPIINLLKTNIYVLAPHNINQLHYINAVTCYETIPIDQSGMIICGDSSVKKWFPTTVDNSFNKERKENILVNLEFDIDEIDKINYKQITIVDDLCDGGATFIAEGEYLKKKFPNKKLKLFVYHGLFTQGLTSLLSYYDEIICTNSYQDIDHPKVTQIKVI
jgi:ribose-phosphate pyrophosphokinase